MNRLKTASLAIILLFAFLVSSFSQKSVPNNKFQSYSMKDGLSQNVVRAIKQDSMGYIWIGTEDGLNKFNGYNFKIFKKEVKDSNSLADNFIYSLAAGDSGKVWVGTNSGGLALYDPSQENFKVFQHNPSDLHSISEGRIYSIHIDEEGNVWAGTFGGGLNLYQEKKNQFKRYLHEPNDPNSITSNRIFDITDDGNGNLWIRTEKDLNKFNKSAEHFTSYDVPGDRLVFEQTNSMFMDRENILWIAYPGGIMKFDTKTQQSELIELKAFKNNTITSICRHNTNHLWVGTYNGLFLLDKTNQSIIASYKFSPTNPKSINDDMIVTLFKDRTGSLWIAHGNTGITKLNTQQKNFTHYKHQPGEPHSIPGNIIRALKVDSKNNIWVGTRNNGTCVINRETDRVRTFEPDPSNPSGMYSNRTTCFFEDNDGDIYMGSWGAGIRVLDGATGSTFRKFPPATIEDNKGLRDSIVQAIHKDDDGVFWIGLEAGLDIYNPQTRETRHIKHDPNDPNSIAPLGVQSNCIKEDANGNYWIGTWGGLTMMRPKNTDVNSFEAEYNYFRLIEKLSDKRVISMHYSKERPGVIFVGTYGGGLNKIAINYEKPNASEITSYTTADGLCNNVIYGILSDNLGNLWLSTNDGLSRFNIEEETFTNFDANDGLQSSQFRWGAYAKGKENELLFGGHNGFNVFKADQVKQDSTLPQIVFTDFKVLNQSIVAGDKINNRQILNRNINQTQKIELSYKEDVFSFEFAALHYAFPEDNQYKYKLEGFDKEWIKVSSEKRFATYTNLDPDTYTFKVMASNYDGIWKKQPKKLKIEITPPFWQTTWFYIVVSVIGISLVVIIIKLRERANRKEKEHLQAKVNEAVSEVEKQKKAMEEKNQELMEKQEEIKRNNWIANGRAKFGDILRTEKGNMADYCYNIISNLVKYVGANVGAFYTINDEDENNPYIEMMGCYAYEDRKNINKEIYIGEGLVGRSVRDHETLYLDKLPENYITIRSGLGQSNPDALIIVPLVTGDEVYGAIEIASLGDFQKIEREFLENLSEDIAVTLKTTKVNMKTNQLLQQSNEQYEELSSQKEEMQQNMEELKATQEESDRRKAEMENLINSLKRSHFFMQYDTDGNIQDINDKYLKLLGKKSDDVVGAHHSELKINTQKKGKKSKTFWKNLLDGKTQKDTLEIQKNNKTHTLSCVYTPIIDQKGNTEKVLQIAVDITEHLS